MEAGLWIMKRRMMGTDMGKEANTEGNACEISERLGVRSRLHLRVREHARISGLVYEREMKEKDCAPRRNCRGRQMKRKKQKKGD
eukprot:6198737-Pleurochrysis_carterae.AAC.2